MFTKNVQPFGDVWSFCFYCGFGFFTRLKRKPLKCQWRGGEIFSSAIRCNGLSLSNKHNKPHVIRLVVLFSTLVQNLDRILDLSNRSIYLPNRFIGHWSWESTTRVSSSTLLFAHTCVPNRWSRTRLFVHSLSEIFQQFVSVSLKRL